MEGHHDHAYSLDHVLDQEFRGAEFQVKPLRGGSDSHGVLHVTARCVTADGQRRMLRFVVKRLPLGRSREVEIYRRFVSGLASHLAPRLLGVEYRRDECRLYLEEIRAVQTWPWRSLEHSRSVMHELAELHEAAAPSQADDTWNYEDELSLMSARLHEAVRSDTVRQVAPEIQQSIPALNRVTAALPQIREQLLTEARGRRTFIHGDVHPGNVTIRKVGSESRPVFMDWGRARFGSPLEDVSSWLQSLGFWEPQAKAKHDTLLSHYRLHSGETARLPRDFRDAYWLAAASNQLAGAAFYHLSNLGNEVPPGRRAKALCAAKDSFRVIRRADACWRN